MPEEELDLLTRIAVAVEKIAANTSKQKKAPEPVSKCRYCGAEIHWVKYGKKSFPVNASSPDPEAVGERHHCKEYEDAKAKEGGK